MDFEADRLNSDVFYVERLKDTLFRSLNSECLLRLVVASLVGNASETTLSPRKTKLESSKFVA